MSEYQCYEFLAIDTPLSPKQQRELREISTRADISATRFWNEYQWGDLKADPHKLLVGYFDIHYYFANWGTRILMIRVPATQVHFASLKPYFSGFGAKASKAGRYVVFEFWSDEDDEPLEDDFSDRGRLVELVPLRDQLLRRDFRSAYLGWLAGVARGASDSAVEPPVPPGLKTLDGSLRALAELLGIESSLLAAAAEMSVDAPFDVKAAWEWLKTLPAATKDRLLLRSMSDSSASIGTELMSEFQESRPAPRRTGRTVAQLHARAVELRSSNQRNRRAR